MLHITAIELRDFRSYRSLRLEGLGGLTVLVGPNAAGKTNVVEAVQLLTAQSSFRNPTAFELVRSGAGEGRALASLSGDGRSLEVGLTIEEGRKRYTLNGKGKHAADLKGLLPSVTFTPDDLELAKGGHARRRAAVDALGTQLSKNHYLIRRDYEKVIRHKNRLLREECDPRLIESVNELVVTCGAQLTAYRSALFSRLLPHLGRCYAQIAGEGERLSACYVPSWEEYDGANPREQETVGRDEAREALARALELKAPREEAAHRALVGPHADKIDFFLNGKNVSSFASQGQQRSVVLSFKMAEAAVADEVLGQKPVMLLDDVMSELDAARRRGLVGLIASGAQTIVTTTNIGYFDGDLLDRARVVEVAP